MDSKLLEVLANSLQISCLSDLQTIPNNRLRAVIKKLEKQNYSIEQWHYVLSYILGNDIQIDKIEDIDKVLYQKNIIN